MQFIIQCIIALIKYKSTELQTSYNNHNTTTAGKTDTANKKSKAARHQKNVKR